MKSSPLFKILVVEDQPAIRQDIIGLIVRYYQHVEIVAYGSVREGVEAIREFLPDLVLLDISLPDGTGFDVWQLTAHSYKIIFLTAFQEFAIRAFRIGAIDYLLKPIQETEFIQALGKVIPDMPYKKETVEPFSAVVHENNVLDRIVLRFPKFVQVIPIEEIIFCQSHSGYTTFHVVNNRKFMVSKYLKEYEHILTNFLFLRPHQSFLVNKRFIERYHTDGVIVLKNGVEIPVSNRQRKEVIAFFQTFQ